MLAATEIMRDRPCFDVVFSDGTVLVADEQHQWRTADGVVRTTGELAATVDAGHAVPHTDPLALPPADLPVAPFTLGAWLGGPPSDAEVHMRVEGEGGFTEELMSLGAHIPVEYQRGSIVQRRDLLAGLLDAGGRIDDDGTIRFSTGCERLAHDLAELVAGLGYACSIDDGVVSFTADDDVFVLPSKAVRHKECRTAVARERRIVAVRPVDVGARPLRGGRRRPHVPRGSCDGAHAQFDPRHGLHAVVLDQARHGVRHLLPGDGKDGDRHAPALRGGEDQAR